MGGKLAIIIFGLAPIALLLWALGVSFEVIGTIFFVAALAVFFVPLDKTEK